MPPVKKQVEISDLYYKLGEMDGKMDSLVEAQHKTIYALIALSGATVGLKLMGSPPLLIISSFINAFVFLFAAIIAIARRRILTGWPFILIFGIMGIIGNFHKIIAPNNVWFRTCFFIIANGSLVFFLWRVDHFRMLDKDKW